MKKSFSPTQTLSEQKNLTPSFRIALAISLIFFLAACQGYTPPPPTPSAGPITSTRLPAEKTPAAQGSAPVPPSHTPAPTLPRLPTLNVSEAGLKGQAITLWYVVTPQDGVPDLLLSQVDEFNHNNAWGILVTAVAFPTYAELFDQAQSVLEANRPSLVTGYLYQAVQMDRSGLPLVDLNAFLEDPHYGLSPAEIADFYPLFWQADVVAGGSYPQRRLGLPFYRNADVLFYNLTWAEELGFSQPPKTPDEFQQQACAAAQSHPGQGSGGWAISTDPASLAGWIEAFGGTLTNPQGDGYAFQTQPVQNAFGFLRQMFDSGCAWQPTSPHPNAEFAGRRSLFISSSLAGAPFQEASNRASSSGDRWMLMGYPSTSGAAVMDVYGPSFEVLRSQPEKELAAWLLVKSLLSPQNQARWVEQTGVFPARRSAVDLLAAYQQVHPHWQQAVDLLAGANGEPGLASWQAVRRLLQDAGDQLFSPNFKPDQLPGLLNTLQTTADDLDQQLR